MRRLCDRWPSGWAYIGRRVRHLQKGALQKERATRRRLEAHEQVGAYLVDMTRRALWLRRARKATPEWRQKVIEWLAGCKFIRISPLQKDTLLVRR